jgi:hypothetical protein
MVDLREHAIFTLRNLLEKNADNQAEVEAMKISSEALTDVGKEPPLTA